MSWYLGMFGTQLSRYKIDSIMKGPGSSAEDVEIIFGNGNQSFDVTSNLLHFGHSMTRGRVLVKSVMKDTSKSLFKGMIKIGKEAKAADAYASRLIPFYLNERCEDLMRYQVLKLKLMR